MIDKINKRLLTKIPSQKNEKYNYRYALTQICRISFGQQLDPVPVLTQQDYLKKSKNQKTAAWVLVAGGLALEKTVVIISIQNIKYGSEIERDTQLLLAFTGAAVIWSSIPLFIIHKMNIKQ